MNTRKLKTMAGGLAAVLLLAVPLYAQMGQMKSKPGDSGMMGCPMIMTGSVMMNGQACQMKADMTPAGKSKGAIPGGMTGSGMMGGKGMSMKMSKPMRMAGTMTCMGQTYHCNMTMTPKNTMMPKKTMTTPGK